MGYYTEFTGTFKFEKPLAGRHLAYLQGFNETNHYHWNPELLQNELDPFREAVGLPLGEHGCYFTGNHTTGGMMIKPGDIGRIIPPNLGNSVLENHISGVAGDQATMAQNCWPISISFMIMSNGSSICLIILSFPGTMYYAG
ncbi:MAG: hypothetical protein M3Y81_21165 [Chloroflexota bacterium]|nr:hypothetical protein [Chloroflexota bacterium]